MLNNYFRHLANRFKDVTSNESSTEHTAHQEVGALSHQTAIFVELSEPISTVRLLRHVGVGIETADAFLDDSLGANVLCRECEVLHLEE